MQLIQQQAPEDRELETKRATLAALEAQFAGRELELATLRATLHVFEKQYIAIVGKRYAELDELFAQIAEAEARLNPQDPTATQKAADVRQQAQESARAASAVDDIAPTSDFHPSETLKKLYRQAAKAMHPDLANSEEDRARRHDFMKRANHAYEAGDEEALRAVLREWESSPESIEGNGVGAELIRIIRRIAKIKERLRTIDAEITALKNSDLSKLKTKVEEAKKQGRDLLAEMASRVIREIAEATRQLAQLK